MLNSHVNAVVRWPDSEDSPFYFALSPLFSSGFSSVFISLALGKRLPSIYMLRCRGDQISWDFFTSLPVHAISLCSSPLSFICMIYIPLSGHTLILCEVNSKSLLIFFFFSPFWSVDHHWVFSLNYAYMQSVIDTLYNIQYALWCRQ